MIKVIVELIPYGMKEAATKNAEMTIINDGKGNHEKGNYTYTIDSNILNENIKGYVKGYDRKKMIWSLIKTILKKEKSI